MAEIREVSADSLCEPQEAGGFRLTTYSKLLHELSERPFLLLPKIVSFKGLGPQNTCGLILLVYHVEHFTHFS